MQPLQKSAKPPVSLDALYALVHDDLRRVDAQILARVQQEIPLIHDIAYHIVGSGGKRIRPALTLIAAQLCNYSGDRHVALAAAVEFIHTATLLHDDVVDESKLRRGLATSNEMFGNKASILVGDFLLSQAFQLMVADGSLLSLKILSDAAAIISKGEVMQLMNEGDVNVSFDNYLSVITAKTAALFAAACELGAVVAELPEKQDSLRSFGMNVGIAFQLVDDALDYNADQKALGKTIGDDFREGKITLPVLLAYQKGNAEEKAFWQQTMGEGKQTENDFSHAVALIAKHHTFADTLKTAETYATKAKDSLAVFTACPARESMLELAEFCINRAY